MTVFHRNETRDPLPERLHGGVIAIGNFDGVHRGHQSVLNRALDEAKGRGVPALVLTFEPHPRTVFRPDQPVFRLTPAPLKARILEGMGFGAVIEYPFDRTFSELSASRFHPPHPARMAARLTCRHRFRFPFWQGAGRRSGLPDGGRLEGRLRRDAGGRLPRRERLRHFFELHPLLAGRRRCLACGRHARLSLHGRSGGDRRQEARAHPRLSDREHAPTAGSRTPKRHLCGALPPSGRFSLRRRRKLRPPSDRRQRWRSAAGDLRLRLLRRSLRRGLRRLLLWASARRAEIRRAGAFDGAYERGREGGACPSCRRSAFERDRPPDQFRLRWAREAVCWRKESRHAALADLFKRPKTP
ncbi:riboflavin biosynthesis protein RibF [Sinorhizobium fredii NGR234]|uniref:FAD synthase n=1 Tax=Sinorhizobium fredii (strain NBRC 101917 / NGR234) TaxID=394 RepID=C3MGU4_SINFN|nr:riboflavin biosynthesis protein RibF [Sinorhizobium fredii NGR234]